MKRLLAVVALVFFAATYSTADATMDAAVSGRMHAEMDLSDYIDAGWGWGSFGLSLLLSPLLGGGGVIIAASLSGAGDVPIHRLSLAQEEFSDNQTAFYTYQKEYEKEATKIRRVANLNQAWIGAGVALGINLVIVIAILVGL